VFTYSYTIAEYGNADRIIASDTILPASTTTTFPTDRLYPGIYLANQDGYAPIPGFPTDINGPVDFGAYDATLVEIATDTVYTDNSTTS